MRPSRLKWDVLGSMLDLMTRTAAVEDMSRRV